MKGRDTRTSTAVYGSDNGTRHTEMIFFLWTLFTVLTFNVVLGFVSRAGFRNVVAH